MGCHGGFRIVKFKFVDLALATWMPFGLTSRASKLDWPNFEEL